MPPSPRPERGDHGLALSLEFGLFALFALLSIADPTLLLRDPGTGWHLATGHQILETARIPVADAFSFTAPGSEWVSFYWLFQVFAAALETVGGLPLFLAAMALVFAAIPVLLFGRMRRMGVGALPALLIVVPTSIVLQAHALARAHLFTYVFFAILLDRLHRFHEGEIGARQLWWIPVLTLVWCNVHGGFVIGPVLAGVFAFGAVTQFAWSREADDRRRTVVLLALTGAMAAATLINPAGPWLHVSILDYFGMESTKEFGEWQGLTFTTQFAPLVVEGVILGLLLLLVTGARMPWIDGLLIVLFLHMALQTVRHTNLFVIVAVPVLAREAVLAGLRVWPDVAGALRRGAGWFPAPKARVAFYGLFSAGFLSLAAAGALRSPDDLDDIHLSAEAAAFIEARPERFRRAFNSDALGGSLIYRFWPELQVFVDDRTPVYGDRFILDDYLRVQRGQPGWDEVLDRWDIETVILNAQAPVAEVLDASPAWRVVHEDDRNAIFFRTERGSVATRR